MSYQGEHIWIIGASSGIGRALADELASRGANLTISARRTSELKQLASEILKKNTTNTVNVAPLDVTNEPMVKTVAQNIARKSGQIDRIIFMAATYTRPQTVRDIDIEKARTIIDVNLTGGLIISKTALDLFAGQSHGQLALCASVAGYIGLPRGQIYSATKAALINLAQTLAVEADAHIDIKLINPGFVETPMTDENDFDMPMIITPQRAALAISRGLKGSGFEIHFPKKFTTIMKLLKVLPNWLSSRLARKLKP